MISILNKKIDLLTIKIITHIRWIGKILTKYLSICIKRDNIIKLHVGNLIPDYNNNYIRCI